MRLSAAVTAVFGCFLLAPAAALAADGESTPLNLDTSKAAAQDSVGSGGGGLVRTIVGLVVVIGVIYGLSWVLKQVKKSKEESHSGTGLAPLGTLPLGPNRSLHLVRAGSEVVLVGVGESGVTPIKTYGEHEARALGLIGVEEPAEEPAAEAPKKMAPPNVRAALRRSLDDLRSKTVIR